MDTIKINDKVYVHYSDASEFVLVRTKSAGVHFGILHGRVGSEVTLRNARRVYYWSGAFTLSEMAVSGVSRPDECKFSITVSEILLLEAIEIIPLSQCAKDNLYGVPAYEP